MKKLSILIAVWALAIVSAAPLTHHQANAPSTILADYPQPPCVPNCDVTLPGN